MIKEKLRSQIDDKYKWDLTTIYENDEKWNECFLEAENELKKVNSYKDRFLCSANDFLQFLSFDNMLERKILKLYYYANLNHDGDTTNNKYTKMYNKARDLYSNYSELTSFVVPEILKLDYETFEKFYKDEPKLLDYKFEIENIYRYKTHTLDKEKEELLSSFSNVFSNPEDTFGALSDSDMSFGTIKDEEDNEAEFNESNYSTFISSYDRRVRKDAFELLLGTYAKYKNTIANCFSGNVEVNVTMARIKKYKSALEASLFSDNVSKDVYNNLILTVNDNLPIMYKYYDVKKKVLGLEEFHLYDVYVPLIKESNKKYTFEEAKDLVISALSVLGNDYIEILKRAFDERWIDVYHNKGKKSGAYSSGFYDTNPFILLNYEGKLDDVSSLAHELGHSMHTYFSCKNNPFHYSSYEIFVAEVASTVNELLLSYYLLEHSNNKNEKLNVINHMLELFKGTIFRQTMFAEFEKNMYEKREEKEVLTATFISDNYFELVKKYFGPNVVVDDLIMYEWERIPHFYSSFYVYKYATSLSASCYIVDGILNNKKGALDNYLKFLKTGGSMYPIDELKIAGVDMNDKKVIQNAINMFDNLIDEFEKLYNS